MNPLSYFLDALISLFSKKPKQPPQDNKYVAPGCELFLHKDNPYKNDLAQAWQQGYEYLPIPYGMLEERAWFEGRRFYLAEKGHA